MSTTNPQDIETEWDSLQRKFGNLPPKPRVVTEEERTKELVSQLEEVDHLGRKSLKELQELEDEVAEDTLEAYRKKRLAELRQRQKRNRFGELLQLGKDEFVKEVTEASAVDPDGATEAEEKPEYQQHHQQKERKGTWVVVHLYKDSVASCRLLNNYLSRVAERNRSIKFLKATSTDVIINYPDTRLPTVLLYFGGVCQRQIVGAEEWGGNAISIKSIEKTLRRFGVLETADAGSEEDGDEFEKERRREESLENEDESDEERKRIRNKGYASTKLDRLLNRRS